MFYDKKSNIHQVLANKFNRNKNAVNEMNKFNKVFETPISNNNDIKIELYTKEYSKENDDILQPMLSKEEFKINYSKSSISIDFNMSNNDDNKKFIRVLPQEIIISTPPEKDSYTIHKMNNNINQTIDMVSDNHNGRNDPNSYTVHNIDMLSGSIHDKFSRRNMGNIGNIGNMGNIGNIGNMGNMDNEQIRLINILHKKNVSVIHNVYQELYKENIKPTGFGDFIRGCYFLLQFCEKYNFKYNIIINHPIALFLKGFYESYHTNKQINQNLFSTISNFVDSNFVDSKLDDNGFIITEIQIANRLTDFMDYLCNINVYKDQIFMYTIFFPFDVVEEKHKQYMMQLLEPNEEMKEYVGETMRKLGFAKNKYAVIHIRSGDMYLSEESKIFGSGYFKKMCNEVRNIINENPSIDFLLLADNNEIKYLICKIFTKIKSIFNNITHLGENKLLDIKKVKNTMLDFYLLANSCSIHSISSYIHGTGFSLWCAKTYSIPYKCKYIPM
jgi:hypothetical protein